MEEGLNGDRRWCVNPGSEESASLGWGGGVDRKASSMDHDMVVEPAQGGEVLCVGCSAVGPGHDVMRLEPVPADTALGGANTAVTGEDETSESGWNGTTPTSHVHRYTVFGSSGDFDHPVTQDRFDRGRSDPRP